MRVPRSSIALALLALAAGPAGCGGGASKGEEAPVACREGSAVMLDALRAVPGEVILAGETPISGCLVVGAQEGELADFGESLPKHAFLEASAARAEVGRELNGYFLRHDLLLCPVSAMLAPKAPWRPDSTPIVPTLTNWCNQTGLPAASVPMGSSAQGLPIGVQLVGRRFADVDVLRASFALERHRTPLAWPLLKAG